MNIIWLIIMLASIGTLLFINPALSVSAMLSGATNAVNLAMQLVAMYAFWLGFFKVLDKLGVADIIARLLRPLIKFLFKGIKEDTLKFVSMNMSANLLGLGNAATPMGINAINSMNDQSPKANTNMIMLVVISATSLQILPSTVIGMRAAHGSANPSDFLIACIISTVASTIIGVILVKLLSKFFTDEKMREKERARAERQKTRRSKGAAQTKRLAGTQKSNVLPLRQMRLGDNK